jgi:hypothetical protein
MKRLIAFVGLALIAIGLMFVGGCHNHDHGGQDHGAAEHVKTVSFA